MRTGLLSAAVIDTDPSCPPLLARAAFPAAPPSGARRTSCRMVARAGPAARPHRRSVKLPWPPADVSAGRSRAHGSVGSLLYKAGADQPFAKPPGFDRWPPASTLPRSPGRREGSVKEVWQRKPPVNLGDMAGL